MELINALNKIEPNFNSHLEKGTVEMSNEYYNLLEEKMVRLINKNQELKYNWNKLRETLKNEQLGSILYSDKKRFADIDEILLKMQELEKSDSNEQGII